MPRGIPGRCCSRPGPGGEVGVRWIVHFSATTTAASTCPDSPTVVHAFSSVHDIASRLVSARVVVCGVACHVPFVLFTPPAFERATKVNRWNWGSLT